MITVNCPSARMNNHKYLYAKWPKTSLITQSIEKDGMMIETELTVEEAEILANELMEWVREIKGEDTP